MISVVIPHKNRPKLLCRAINSVLPYALVTELIIVDDESEKDISSVIDKINDDRINLIKLQESVGSPKAKNIGVQHANNEIISFLDSDDYWRKDLTKVILKSYPFDVFVSDYIIDNGKQITVESKVSQLNQFKELIYDKWLPPNTSTLTFNKNFYLSINGFDENIKSCQDHDLWFRISEKRDVVLKWCADRCIALDRIDRSDSMSLDFEKRNAGFKQLVSKWEDKISRKTSRRLFNNWQKWYAAEVFSPFLIMFVRQKRFASIIKLYFLYLCTNKYFYAKIIQKLVNSRLKGLYWALYNSLSRRDIRYLTSCNISFKLPADINIPHPVGIVIGRPPGTHLGKNCTVMQNVTIGVSRLGEKHGPKIGNNVFIGAGAVIVGNLNVPDGAIIRANSVTSEKTYE